MEIEVEYRPELSETDKIIQFIADKRRTLDTFLTKPLFQLQKNVVYKGMLADGRMKKIVARILSDAAFREGLHHEIARVFGHHFARHLGRIILPPGSLWP
jgi:hypothetical protein